MGNQRLHRCLPLTLGLWLLAVVQYFWVTPQLLLVPADYASETHYETSGLSRETPTGKWLPVKLIARRVDQTVAVPGRASIIQGDMHWTTDGGHVLYETTGLYGVDRRSRMNLPGYGNRDRTGLFLFPPHTQPRSYTLWDPFYGGPRAVTFQRATTLDGMRVYLFHFVAAATDDTSGYTSLPDVPERYDVLSDGRGRLWVEPVSGVVVDFEDAGVSYFVTRPAGKRIADLYYYRDRYTTQTRAAQLELAAAERRRILMLERWLPVGLFLIGLLWLMPALWPPRRSGKSVRSAAN